MSTNKNTQAAELAEQIATIVYGSDPDELYYRTLEQKAIVNVLAPVLAGNDAELRNMTDQFFRVSQENAALQAEVARLKQLNEEASLRISEINERHQAQRDILDAENAQLHADKEAAEGRILAIQEYAFGMESALCGARASGTASEFALWKAECAELRLLNYDLRLRLTPPAKQEKTGEEGT